MRIAEIINEAARDPKVAELQEKLKSLGYDLGHYGPKGDGVDGIVGPYTRAAMTAYSKGISPTAAPKPAQAEVSKYNKEVNAADDVPTGVPVNGRITSPFGYRTSVGAAHNHNGTDFAVPVGTPVHAPQAGVVKSAGSSSGHEGNYVILDAGGVIHKFFHLSKVMVNAGDRVEDGDVLALSGSTGRSTGPHLHWEKHIAGRPVDPMANIG